MKSLKLLQNIFFIGAFSLLVQTSWGQITGTINGVAITSNHVVCPYTDYTIVLSGAACYFNEGGDATIEKKNAGVYAPFNSPGYIDGTATLIIRFTGANARTLVVTEGNGGCNAKKVSSPLVTTFSFNVQPLAHPAFGSATVSGCTGNDLTLDGNAPASLTCTGTVCATLATYQWEQGGSPIPGATSPNYTIPQAVIDAITPAVTGQIVYTVNTTVIHGGGTITCYDEASVTVTRNDPPVLNAISLSAMPLQICANGTDVLSVECTSGCDAGATYTWQYKTIGAYADVPANVSSNLTTGTYINTLTLDGTSPALTPGLYDIQVIVENSVTKCATTSAEATNSVSINDLPGVEILHNYGAPDWTGATTSDNGVIICTGKELQLQPRGCDATNYSNDYTANQSSDLGPNVNQADDATAITYTSPCTGAGNDFFETLTWSATGSVTGALSIGGFPTLVINNPNATTNISTIYTNLQETITYTLLVEGVNGCTNTDNITIVSTAPDISFSYPASGMTTHSGGQTISGCEGTTVTIEGLCDLCNETPITSSWTQSIAGPNANGLPSSPSTSNPVTSETLTSTAANQYTLVMTDATGCTGSDVINVDDLPAPVITVAGTTPLCSGSPLRIDVTGFNAAYDYKVYDGDPNSGGALVWSCTTSCVPTNPLVTNINPVNGTDYYVVATLSTGTCADTASTGALAVTTTPSPYTINVAPASGICNYYSYPFYLGGGSSAYTYTWTISSNPVGSAVWTGAGTAPWLPGTPPEPSGTGFTTGGFFGPSPYGFTLGYSESITYAAVNLSVVVTNGACSANLAWPPFKIIDCQAPILQAATSYTPSGQSNHSNLALGQVGLTNDYDYVCEGGTIQLKADIGNSYYDPLYEWSSGETTESIYITTSSSTPDTVTRSVIVYKDNGGGTKDSISTLYHTFVVSRGGTNFNFYPDGVNSGAIDTSICRDESLFAQANCPTCRGSAFLYIWNASPPNTAEADLVTNSTPYQSYITLPATANFSVSLTFTHGESCREIIDRQIGVNALPTVTLREVSTGANITSATPLYLCDSDSIQLIAGCTAPCNAALSSFQWNTGATTPSINVATQGGYYALVTDQNECRKISEIGVVIDALDGLNSPVVANPSQICSGDDVVLEVAPCMGCSYQWIDESSGFTPIPSGRTHTTSDTGSYYAQVTNPQGCVYPTAQVSVTETSVAVPSISSTTDSICSGGTATLSTPFNASFGYQWYWNGGAGSVMSAVSGAITSTYTTSNIGTYQVAVTYPNGCIKESAFLVIRSATFTPAIYSSGAVICRNETVDVSTDLYAGWQYQWYRNGILISGATGSVYSAAIAGSYYAQVTNYNLCVEQTNAITLTTASIPIPNATTGAGTVCSGEYGELSVSLCSGCSYQWFNDDGIAISINSTLGYNYNLVTATDGYFAVVSLNGCSENSDTVVVTINTVFTPAINTSSNVVCDGQSALLITPSCTACSYSWLLDSLPVLGALNDTFHLVDNPIDSGDYQIAVTYQNGCSDTSAILRISDGSYSLNLRIDTIAPSRQDSVICNGVGETLIAIPSNASTVTGTFFYTLFLDNTPVTSFSNVTSNTFLNRNIAGVYTVQSTDPRGCRELSNILPLRAVSVAPFLASNATSDPSSVNATAICTDSGTVYMQVSSCDGCSLDWTLQGNSIYNYVDSIIDTLFLEDFEGGGLPAGWTRTQAVGSNGWLINTAASLSSPGFTIPLANPSNVAASNDTLCQCDMSVDFLITPMINLSTLLNTKPVVLSFDAYHPSLTNSTAVVKISAVGVSGPWDTIAVLTPSLAWQNLVLDLSSYYPDTMVWIAFQHDDNGRGDGFAIDNVSVGTPESAPTAYTTLQGNPGTGIYIVIATNDGCSAASNPITVADLINTFDSSPNTTDTSICNGQSVILEHDGSAGNPSLNCSFCSFRWLRTPNPNTAGNPINGASNYQYLASTQGYYYLELTTTQGCVDTSGPTIVRQVDPPAGMMLYFDSVTIVGAGTPLASNGTTVDLNNWIFPPSVRNAVLSPLASSYFTSAPFNGALPAHAGLEFTDSILFNPHDSLAGFHLITYHYDTLGCEFTVEDVLEVLPPASITVTNANPSSVAYEACVGDQLTINTVNLEYPINQVFAFDANDIYDTLDLISAPVVDTNIYGVDTFYNTTLVLDVPGGAYACYLMLVDSIGTDTTFTSYVLIHNTDLSFTGLPNMLCSNNTGITLFGNPSGGVFSATDTTAAHNVLPGAVVGNILYPSLFNPAGYVNGGRYVDIFYSYTETYTNGNLCPDDDTVSQRIEVKDMRLTSVEFNKVSVSQDKELLTDLVYRVLPYRARANKPNYEISFAGSFTFPAGNPVYFLPRNAGVGFHPLTYKIKSGDCINTMTANIQVVPAPAPINLPDTICRNHGTVTFGRSAAYPYLIPSPYFFSATTSYTDTFHIMRVYSENNNQALTVLNPNPGVEQYLYNPTALTGPNSNYDTLIVEYWFRRIEDTAASPLPDFDTLDYVVGRIYQPVYIEDLDTVSIIDTIVNSFYCEENVLHLLAASPTNNAFGDGLFMLYGGTGQYATGDTLPNSVINPYQVNSTEGAVTTYDLVYILNGAACNNSDTMSITISEGLYPWFRATNGLDSNAMHEFCDTDPSVGIMHNVLAPDTAIWKIGGVPQSAYIFAPQPLDPGIHVVELQMVDTFGCSATAKDTFIIHALPALSMTPGLSPQYCANDPTVNLIVGPAPGCPSFAAPEQYLLNEKFDAGIPPTWTILHTAGKFWTPTAVLPQGGTGGAAFVDSSSVLQNSWLVADTLDLIQGHIYRLTYMVRAGELNPACSGFCDASLRVGLGSSPTSLGISLDYQAAIDNDDTYVRYAVNYTHIYNTGKYYLGFNSFSPAFGRSLRLDNVMLRDITPNSCNLAGIGYIDGPGIHNIQDSLYQFNPLAVDPGNIEVKYIYTNVNGCKDSLVYPVLVDSFPIVSFTNMDSSYCANEPGFQITGSPLGGAFTSTLDSNLIHIPFTAPLDTAFYPVNYGTNVPGTDIVSYTYTDGNGCSDTYRDTVVIVPMLDSAIVDNALDPFGIGHCENALPSVLDYIAYTGAPLPGAFYGPGVRNGLAGPGAAMFHPDSAVIDMGHSGNVTITYIYLTTTNCVDTTRYTTEVHALPDLSFMNLPDSLCLNAQRFQVLVINSVVTGSMGQIMYEDTLGNQTGTYTVTDLNGMTVSIIGLFDSLTPSLATGYDELFVSYTHTVDTAQGGCTATIYDSIRIDTVPVTYFQGMQDFYCANDPQSIILAFPPYKVGSGYMLIDTLPIDTSWANVNARMDSSYFWLYPLAMLSSTGATTVYPSYYTYTDTRGCRGEVYDTFEIRPFPQIVLSPTFQDTFCRQPGTYNLMQEIISPKGGFFTDNLALTSIVNDTMLDLNSAAGPRLVTYHFIDSTTTCYNNDSIWLYLFNAPFLDFNVFGGCSGMDITFDGYATNLIEGIDSITRIEWEFETPGLLTLSSLDTSPVTLPDIIHQYTATGTYIATLHVENQGNCIASISKPVIISPSVAMVPDYFEDFENGAGDWYSDQAITTTPSNIWSHTNSLGGIKINDPGNAAWVTMGDSLYGKGQAAWVYSPCFDFTNSLRPMIAFDIWRDMLEDIDGVVMEYYNYQANTWDRIGDVGQGINWYQSNFVLGRPGEQANVTYPRGWTGRKNGFESARLRLDPFRGQRFVRFRLAFASSPQTVISNYEGAAFDNVWVGERTRNVLLEHFDNRAYVSPGGQNSDVIDQGVYDQVFNTAYGIDVFMIQYQSEISSATDPVNLRTLADASARTYLYGITDDNQFMLDGRKVGTGISSELDPWDMDYDMLQFPDFDIDISIPTITGNTINVSSTVTALKNLTQKDYAVHTVVIQDSLTMNANGFNMLSVMRKMLPNAAGIRYNQAWTIGSSVVTPQSWDFSGELGQASFNSNQLEVIVFIQDMNSEEVFQVQTTQDLNKYTGTGQLEDEVAAEILDLKVYPNPSSDLFNVEFDKELEGAYNWRLVDVTGRILQTGIAEQGTKTFTIDAEKLTNGAYFFVINSDTVYAQRKLVVIK